jgi:hypothetical protein
MMTIAKDNGIKPFVMTIPNSGFDDKVPQVVSTRALINQEIRRVYPGSFIDLQEKIPHLEMPADERKTMWDDNLHLSGFVFCCFHVRITFFADLACFWLARRKGIRTNGRGNIC